MVFSHALNVYQCCINVKGVALSGAETLIWLAFWLPYLACRVQHLVPYLPEKWRDAMINWQDFCLAVGIFSTIHLLALCTGMPSPNAL